MSEVDPRYLVLRRRHGEITSAIEYGDYDATRREIKQNRAERREISIPEAMMGPTALVERMRHGIEVGRKC